MFTFWHRWLQVAFAGMVVLGIDLALFGDSVLFAPLNDPLNVHFFGAVQVTEEVASYQRFAFGIMGALTAGWALLALFVVRNAFAPGEAWAWYGLALGFGLWYGVDTVLSAYHGAIANVISNSLLALLIAVPLVAVRKHVVAPADRSRPAVP
jgi:hypothetical protein